MSRAAARRAVASGASALSRVGATRSRGCLLKADVADPVSGFFMLRREAVDEVAPRLSGIGIKILIDILASAPRPLAHRRVALQVSRPASAARASSMRSPRSNTCCSSPRSVGHRYFSHRLLLFGLVGATGVVVNLAVLRLCCSPAASGSPLPKSIATVVAMVSNFFLNNMLTYRDCRLVGWQAVRGLASFMAVCGLGALVNVAVARDLYDLTGMWLLAGIAGAAIGALLNYALTSFFTWGRRR